MSYSMFCLFLTRTRAGGSPPRFELKSGRAATLPPLLRPSLCVPTSCSQQPLHLEARAPLRTAGGAYQEKGSVEGARQTRAPANKRGRRGVASQWARGGGAAHLKLFPEARRPRLGAGRGHRTPSGVPEPQARVTGRSEEAEAPGGQGLPTLRGPGPPGAVVSTGRGAALGCGARRALWGLGAGGSPVGAGSRKEPRR